MEKFGFALLKGGAILLAVFALSLGIFGLVGERTKLNTSIYTNGLVTATHGDATHLSTISITFKTKDDQNVTFQAANVLPVRNVGDYVTIAYNPHNPHNAQTAAFADIWFYPLLSIWLGLLFLTLVVGASLFKRYINQHT